MDATSHFMSLGAFLALIFSAGFAIMLIGLMKAKNIDQHPSVLKDTLPEAEHTDHLGVPLALKN